MLLRFYPFVGIWRFDMMMYIDLMTCIFWRCMTYIRCDCWWILYMHVVWILMWRRSVYFLNIYIIRVYYHFNRNKALQFWCEDVASISWIFILFACIITLIEIGRYNFVSKGKLVISWWGLFLVFQVRTIIFTKLLFGSGN